MSEDRLCPCGQPLHYRNPESRTKVEAMVAELGMNVRISIPAGSWMVPREYIALHGVRATALPTLARRYGWAPA